MSDIRTGGCQCGAIRFRTNGLMENAHVCHCRMCQKATGNFFAALVGVPLKSLIWTRGALDRFRSSAKVSRGFCAACGTPLSFRHDDAEYLCLSIGSFDDPSSIPLNYQLGMEARLPQVDQLTDLEHRGTTEEYIADAVDDIHQSNRQHPDHDTETW